jgi:hypothetical protein
MMIYVIGVASLKCQLDRCNIYMSNGFSISWNKDCSTYCDEQLFSVFDNDGNYICSRTTVLSALDVIALKAPTAFSPKMEMVNGGDVPVEIDRIDLKLVSLAIN